MSVWVYKDGEKELIAPEFLDGQIEAGWSVTEGVVEAVEEAAEVVGVPTEPTNEEVRAAAKAKGIEGWDIKRIQTLKEMLE